MSRADRSASRRRLDGLLSTAGGLCGAAPWTADAAPPPRAGTEPTREVVPVTSPDELAPWPPRTVPEHLAAPTATAAAPTAKAEAPPASPLAFPTRSEGGPPAVCPVPRFPPGAPSDGAAAGAPPAEPEPLPVTPSGGWVPRALSVAATGYRASYGTATDLSGDDEPTVRVRWAVPWRLAASAAAAIALVVGATLIRATALAPGDPVDLPSPAVVAADASGATSAEDRASGGPSSTATAGQVVVHVVGAVASPGVVRLPSGSRLEDAITAAGGALPDANLQAVNLARVLSDGEQVEVPRPGEAGEPTAAADGPLGTPVDLNTADLADLDALPGIGPVLAQRILDRRTSHRFTSVEELGEVSGIGPTLLQRLRPLVRV